MWHYHYSLQIPYSSLKKKKNRQIFSLYISLTYKSRERESEREKETQEKATIVSAFSLYPSPPPLLQTHILFQNSETTRANSLFLFSLLSVFFHCNRLRRVSLQRMCTWTGAETWERSLVTVRSFPDQWPPFRRRKPPALALAPAPTRSRASGAEATAWALTSASRRAVVVASRAGGSRLSVELQARWRHLLVRSPVISIFRRRWCCRLSEARTWWFGTRRILRNRKPICPVRCIFHFCYLFSVFIFVSKFGAKLTVCENKEKLNFLSLRSESEKSLVFGSMGCKMRNPIENVGNLLFHQYPFPLISLLRSKFVYCTVLKKSVL